MTNEEAEAFAAQLAKGFKRIGDNLRAMTVLGDVLRGDLPASQQHIAALPVETVQELSAAAALLTSLADEELMRRG